MRKVWRLSSVLMLALLVFALPAAAGRSGGGDREHGRGKNVDDLRSPMQKEQDRLNQEGLELKLKGKAKGKVAQIAIGQYAQLQHTGEDKIFVILAEFGNTRHSAFCDPGQTCAFPPDGSAATYEGPAHNSIPAPDRSQDNTTLWQSDFSKAHYENMYFNRMAAYYQAQSSGRYTVNGQVTNWVKVPFNEARYGRDYCGAIVCNNTWFLVRDALAYWVQGQLDQGQTMAQINAYLASYDKQDRYDADGDGNFDEPDGFIDHFQIVHAGGDQAAGDPSQGSDAIWSHRWYAALYGGGPNGFPGVPVGRGGTSSGVRIPSNPTDTWVGDYTIQPENGGLGVFAHEYGHDLGLPDLYDTSGNTGGAENETGFWTLMSSGANIGDGGPNGIGDAPTNMGAWEKFQLGWLGCETCPGGTDYYAIQSGGPKKAKTDLAPAGSPSKKGDPHALFVVLPDKKKVTFVGTPYAGSYYWWSTSGDNLNVNMTKAIPGGGALTAKVNYDIEAQYDYAFIEASTDGGLTFAPLLTNLSTPASLDQSGINSSGAGIDGSTGGRWVDLTATVPAGATHLRVRYETDAGYALSGFQIDDITVGAQPTDGAEADAGWTYAGFKRTTGTETSYHLNAYVGEYRAYQNYDRSLATAYNFGFLNARPDWVESYPYQDGLLLSYWDESYSDNNVGDHPGGGLVLPIDSHPEFFHDQDGFLLRPRTLAYDATFAKDKVDSITIHKNSTPITIPARKEVKEFNDLATWWYPADEHGATGAHPGRYQPGWYGVDVPKTGTTIEVKEQNKDKLKVEVSTSK